MMIDLGKIVWVDMPAHVARLLAEHPSIDAQQNARQIVVTCDAFDDDTDPLTDDHFANDWDEALGKIQTYIDALKP